MPDGTVCRVHISDADRVLGRNIDAEALVEILQDRIDSTQQGRLMGSSALSTVSASRISVAAQILAEVHHPEAFYIFVRLLDDPHSTFREDAAYCLAKLGDKRAMPHLLEALRNGKRFGNSSLERAIIDFGDPNAIPDLIEAIQVDPGDLSQFSDRVSAIEKLSGLSVRHLVPDRFQDVQVEIPQIKQRLRDWWEEHRESILGAKEKTQTR